MPAENLRKPYSQEIISRQISFSQEAKDRREIRNIFAVYAGIGALATAGLLLAGQAEALYTLVISGFSAAVAYRFRK